MAGLVTAVALAPLALVAAAPARAAQPADPIECGAAASVFAAQPDGALVRQPLNSPQAASAALGAESRIGTSWNGFGRVLGGPDGRVYGINSTGLYRYRWTGTTWEALAGSQRLQISTSFTAYATAAYRNRITVDERGDFYLIDSVGKLRWYRYDETAQQWTIAGQILASGWLEYDLIVAAGPGVLYSRTHDGRLFRHRFEPVSQRWIVRNQQVGSNGWQSHTRGLFSVGGDTLFGIQADGDLFQYRYREDTGAWAVPGRLLDTGWQGYPNVFATTNACRLTVSHTPTRPDAPASVASPTVVLQPGSAQRIDAGPVHYLYTGERGVRHGRQGFRDVFDISWSTISKEEPFTGRPAVTEEDQLIQVAARKANGDIWFRSETAGTPPDWQAPRDLGGMMASAPSAVQMSSGGLAVFALDSAGALWVSPEDGSSSPGDLLPWRSLGGTGMTGDLVSADLGDRTALLLAADANGTLHTATYTAGGGNTDSTVTKWASLGDSGFTGTPSIVTLPGPRPRIFARNAAGEIVTQAAETGKPFPGVWERVGGPFTAAGPPAAILDEMSSRITVVARGQGDEVYFVTETLSGSQQWGEWARISPKESDPAAVDPTLATFRDSNALTFMITYRDVNDGIRIYLAQWPPPTRAGDRKESVAPTFTRHLVPTAAKKKK
jgi:hypothetical protein